MIGRTPAARPSFNQCLTEAYRLLGDAADAIRIGEYPEGNPTPAQRASVSEALGGITAAKNAINDAKNAGFRG